MDNDRRLRAWTMDAVPVGQAMKGPKTVWVIVHEKKCFGNNMAFRSRLVARVYRSWWCYASPAFACRIVKYVRAEAKP